VYTAGNRFGRYVNSILVIMLAGALVEAYFVRDDIFAITESTPFDFKSCKTKYENVQSLGPNLGVARALKVTGEVSLCAITFCWLFLEP
jgi:hypothetical protein